MKNCEFTEKGLCLGCVGLGEEDWVGPEQCLEYKKIKNSIGIAFCKELLKGEQMKMI